MFHKQPRVFWSCLAFLALVISTIALVRAHSGRTTNIPAGPPSEIIESTAALIQKDQKPGTTAARNLSLQPEAFNLSRRLGKRFLPGKREQSMVVGTLTIGAEQKTVRTIRKQTDDGEQVEIKIEGSPGSLTWEASQGAFASATRAHGGDRDLIERLVFDSPDQFVLAQLRGATYSTIARNVRLDNVDSGALWNVVRVEDPEPDERKRPASRWRLYYLNLDTNLIGKIVSEISGQRITADISWTDVDGEKVPAQIIWSTPDRTLMQYSVTNFSHAEVAR